MRSISSSMVAPTKGRAPAIGDQALNSPRFAYLINSDDVRMIERGCRLGLTLEPAAVHGAGEFIREELNRNGAVLAGIDGAVDGAHPASTG